MRSRLDTEIDPMLHVQRPFYGGFLFSFFKSLHRKAKRS